MQQDHFALFDLQPSFDIDASRLDRAYREVQNRVHPDKFVGASSAEQRVAMQWATHANEAYQTLKSPISRARYLLQLHGIDTQEETNTAMPAAFLMQQMAWREALDEARSVDRIQALADEVAAHAQAMQAALGALIDERQDWPAAAAEVRALMFLARFAQEVDRRLDALLR